MAVRQFTDQVSQLLFNQGQKSLRWISFTENNLHWTALWRVNWMPGVKLVGSLDENEEPAKGFRAVVWIQFEQRDNNPNGRVYVVIDDKGMQYAESDALRNVLQTIVDEPFAHPDYITLLTSAQAFLNGGGRQDVFSLDITFANPNDHQRTSDHILHFLPLLHHYLIRV